MNINVKSIFLSIKHGLEHLKKNRRSYVVNIGSVGSFIGQGSTPAYTTSKGAVLMLSKSIALDYAADGVRCNCVCPGITDTPMLREHLNMTADPEATLRKRLRRVPMGIPLTPQEIARAVLYFSCEDSAGVTGTSLVVDGGYLAAAEWEHPGRTRFMEM
jgi:NAD(P)-dependent dehydrogenase (short-subunit alcohol dehydrogenase family)